MTTRTSAGFGRLATLSAAIVVLFCSADTVAATSACATGSEIRLDGPEHVRVYYTAISALPVDDQITMFEALPNELKVALWRHQLTRFADTNAQLTVHQRAVISDALSLLSVDLYTTPLSTATWTDAQGATVGLKQRAIDAFGPDLAAELLTRFGVALKVTPGSPTRPNPIRSRRGVASEALQKPCTCSFWDDYCTSPYYCASACDCKKKTWGCGTFFAKPCDGVCYNPDFGLPIDCY